jgi:zinc protease
LISPVVTFDFFEQGDFQSSIGQSDALKYETNYDKASFLSRIQEYHLKADFVAEQNAILSGINVEQVNELARKYLDPSRMSILVVGDKEKITPGLQKQGYNIVELDADANVK